MRDVVGEMFGGGRRKVEEEEERGVAAKKQEPHTAMWGKRRSNQTEKLSKKEDTKA